MVRWITIERPLSFKYHFVTGDPEFDDQSLYGWQGDVKEPRPYRFVPSESSYGYRPETTSKTD